MQSFSHFSEGKDTSHRVEAMAELVRALQGIFSRFDVTTRRLLWKRLNTARGHELVEKLLRNPQTNTRMSEFRKLVEGG